MNKNYVTTKEASVIIGCSHRWVRQLCRDSVLKCKSEPLYTYNEKGKKRVYRTRYLVLKSSAEAYANSEQPTGFPRGGKRS